MIYKKVRKTANDKNSVKSNNSLVQVTQNGYDDIAEDRQNFLLLTWSFIRTWEYRNKQKLIKCQKIEKIQKTKGKESVFL